MTESKKKILEMLAKNRISADDAYKLLNAVDDEEAGSKNESRNSEETLKKAPDNIADKGLAVKLVPKYLRVTVTPSDNPEAPGRGNLIQDGNVGRVNVRVPMSLIRAGLKMTSLIPPDALDKANSALREKGINFDVRNIKSGDIEELIEALGDMEVDVEGGHGEKIKVFVEY